MSLSLVQSRALLGLEAAPPFHTKEGQGSGILFIHGFGGNREVWKEVSAALVRDHTVIRVDLPGSGERPGPALVEGGADMFLMPSLYEPCGLNQMYSLAYGTPPLVRATGGLADTVVNYSPAALADGSANGFVCQAATAEAILGTAGLATLVWQDKARWRQLQRNAMAGDFRWTGPARQYLDLYESLRPA